MKDSRPVKTYSKTPDKDPKEVKTHSKTPEEAPKPVKIHSKTSEESPRQILKDITPQKDSCPVYISPFVTISRGKNSARKEYVNRRSLRDTLDVSLKEDVASFVTPTAGAAYFMNILNENTDRIEGMIKEWEMYKVRVRI